MRKRKEGVYPGQQGQRTYESSNGRDTVLNKEQSC